MLVVRFNPLAEATWTAPVTPALTETRAGNCMNVPPLYEERRKELWYICSILPPSSVDFRLVD